MNIWQVAAGDGSRDYSEVCLNFGVFLVGPGYGGNYFANKASYNDTRSPVYRQFIQPFAERLAPGDLIALKRPIARQWEIIAVGEIVSEYVYQEAFRDVEGWDLQHCRLVRWKKPINPVFVSGLTRGTLKHINNQQTVAAISQVWSSGKEVQSLSVPAAPEEISFDEVIEALIVDGLPGQRAELIATTVWRLRRMAKWYSEHSSDVGEHEIRTFLIVPLLISLGWAEQKVKIEWNNMDVVLFDSVYRKGTSQPIVIIESKRLWDGLRYAPGQATNYAQSYPTCTRFLVTDGIRYKLFSRIKGQWRYTAYANLTSPTRIHPYEPGVEGAISFFRSMIGHGV
jgi:hypothetical protein